MTDILYHDESSQQFSKEDYKEDIQMKSTVRNSKLFCHACKEVLALKKSSIEYHSKSQKHINGKKEVTQTKRFKHLKPSMHMTVRFIQLVMVYKSL